MIAKVSVDVTATLISAAKDRKWFLIQNQGGTDVFVSIEGSSDVTVDTGSKPGFLLKPGESLGTMREDFRGAVSNALYGIASVAPSNVSIQEF